MSKKLLLADDSITIQKVIGITFANEDYELSIVDNGDSALERARLETPDIILADVFMPGKNGYELCAAVRQDPTLKKVPVLLLTGTFEPFDENKAKASGADSWIAKPFESQALIDRVEGLLARAEAAPPEAAPAPVPAAPPLSPTEPSMDIWGELAEATSEPAPEFPPSNEFFTDEPVSAPTALASEPAGEAPVSEDDIWGAVSFDEEELLGIEPPTPAADDIWGSMDGEAAAAAEKTAEGATEDFLFEAEPFTAEAAPAAAQPASEEFLFEEEPFAPMPASELGEPEEEILPLEEFDILDEEEIAGTANNAEEPFAFEEEDAAFPFSTSMDIAGLGESAIAAEEEFPLIEEGPEWGIAEESGIAIEPSVPAAEEVFITPAEAAMEQAAPAIPIAAAAIEERLRTLSEEDLSLIVERVAGSVIERLAGSVLERIAWEVVPDLAENMVREEIRKIREGVR